MKPQVIVFSVWRCRGLWYHKAWALDGKQVFDAPSHYKGCRSESRAQDLAAQAVASIRTKHPHTEYFPVVAEHSDEWKAMLFPDSAAA